MAHPSAVLVHHVLRIALDVAATAANLNGCLKANRAVIGRLHAVAPALWEDLRAHAHARRTDLSGAGPGAPTARRHPRGRRPPNGGLPSSGSSSDNATPPARDDPAMRLRVPYLVTKPGRDGATIPELCAITGHDEGTAVQVLRHYLAMSGDLANSAITKLIAHEEAERARSKREQTAD